MVVCGSVITIRLPYFYDAASSPSSNHDLQRYHWRKVFEDSDIPGIDLNETQFQLHSHQECLVILTSACPILGTMRIIPCPG